jgi:hypothetical protein
MLSRNRSLGESRFIPQGFLHKAQYVSEHLELYRGNAFETISNLLIRWDVLQVDSAAFNEVVLNV